MCLVSSGPSVSLSVLSRFGSFRILAVKIKPHCLAYNVMFDIIDDAGAIICVEKDRMMGRYASQGHATVIARFGCDDRQLNARSSLIALQIVVKRPTHRRSSSLLSSGHILV
ncbi:uncharacterized protein UTRI_03219 [Ustilago trichophora]|uniref:Uncharacterized protein n=1 Tax=Ustilago trichophora TaxID=86804 RepID=A0A5C3E586_9BASI|nr:uncharacterized protein UTRI_03219 [Ustilago trichophora]